MTKVDEGSILDRAKPASAVPDLDRRRDSPSDLAEAVKLLVGAGRTEEAEVLLQKSIVQFPRNAEAYRLLCDLYLSTGKWQSAVDLCCSAPGAKLRTILAHQLIDADRPHDALDVIESARELASDDSTWFRVEFAAGSALDAAGLEEEAIECFNRAALLRPDDLAVLQRLTIYDREQGRWPQNRPRLLELQKQVVGRLPPTLAEGLRDGWSQAREPRSMSPTLAWAWKHADQQRWKQEEWLVAARWGYQAHKLLRSWWRWAPERADEITALVEAPDLSPLRNLVARRQGCFLTGAHAGATLAGVELLRNSDLPFVTVGFAGGERAVDDGRDRRISITANRTATTRAVIRSLNSGDVVGWPIDSPVGATVTFDFLGSPVRLVAAVPKIVRRYAGASFWLLPLWREDRIIIEIERLPDPVPGESEADWTSRWYRAYLDCFERIVRGDPRNLVCQGGMWLNFAPVRRFGVAQALERRWAREKSASAH